MNLVKNLTAKFILLLCLSGNVLHGQNDTETIQINLEGKDLSHFMIEVDGNSVRINGMKPVDAGVKLNLIRKKTGVNSMTVAEYGLEMKTPEPVKEKVKGTPYMGIVTIEKDGGLQIIEINSIGPARKSGLKLGDILTKINGTLISDHNALMSQILPKSPGETIEINFKRGARELNTQMVLASKPEVLNARENVEAKAVVYERPKSLGIKIREGKDKKSWRIIEVKNKSAAEKSGLLVNDNIIEMNGKKIDSAETIDDIMRSASINEPIIVKVKRAGVLKTIKIE